jgi:hypothetical protein
LHVHFIQISDQKGTAGKGLHKYLEKKYRADTKKYLKAETEAEIIDLWNHDLADGRVDAAWWSVVTHPNATALLVARLYGQVHMLGHDRTNSMHRERQLIANLRAKSEMLEEIVGSERQFFRQDRQRLEREICALQTKNAESVRHQEEHLRQQTEMTELHQQIKILQEERDNSADQLLIGQLRQDNKSLHGQIDKLSFEIELLSSELANATKQLDNLDRIRHQLEHRENEQTSEIASLEAFLFQHLASEQGPCSRCADQNTENCPGPNLCGKTVLYVGGLHKMVPHYRQLVEQFGGRFLHHDGGREASRNLLPKLLTTADAVLCPIDCVSHDACNCVKKMCKRYQKPFILMRSSGLSSLARGLDEIVH